MRPQSPRRFTAFWDAFGPLEHLDPVFAAREVVDSSTAEPWPRARHRREGTPSTEAGGERRGFRRWSCRFGVLVLIGTIGSVSSLPATAGAIEQPSAATAWSIEHTPNAHVANGKLFADSCSSASSCVAVGSYADSSGTSPLAEVWSRANWRIVSPPTPSGGVDTVLDGLSCTAPMSSMGTGRRGACRPPLPLTAISSASRALRLRPARPSGMLTASRVRPTSPPWSKLGTAVPGRSKRRRHWALTSPSSTGSRASRRPNAPP
jgi:hypothetical protein